MDFRVLLTVPSYCDLFSCCSPIISFTEVQNIHITQQGSWQWPRPASCQNPLMRIQTSLVKNPHFAISLQPRKQPGRILSLPGLPTHPAFILIFIHRNMQISCDMGWKLLLSHFQKTSGDFSIGRCVR